MGTSHRVCTQRNLKRWSMDCLGTRQKRNYLVWRPLSCWNIFSSWVPSTRTFDQIWARIQTRTCIQRRKDLFTSDRSIILAQQDKHEWHFTKNNEPNTSRYKWVFSCQYVSLLALQKKSRRIQKNGIIASIILC